MVTSSKGKPTDPKLMEKVTEEVKNMTNKDGGGKGQMSAWKAAKRAQEYEKRGGGYENEAGSKNEPKEGTPEEKSDSKKKVEEKDAAGKDGGINGEGQDKLPAKSKGSKAKGAGSRKSSSSAGTKSQNKKDKPTPREGTRKSSRVAQQKRPAEDESNAPKTKKAKGA